MRSGPQYSTMGKRELRQMLTADRKLWGQSEAGPNGVAEKSKERMSAPISPPPLKKSYVGVSFWGMAIGLPPPLCRSSLRR